MVGFIDTMRAEGRGVESICRVLVEQGHQSAARTYRARRRGIVAARTVSDVYSQRIVAWHAQAAEHVELVMIPLRMGLWERGRQGSSGPAGSAAGAFGCRVSIRFPGLQGEAGARWHRAHDRVRRRRVRHRADGDDQRPLQSRVHPHDRVPRRPLPDHRRWWVRDRRLGRLVQHS